MDKIANEQENAIARGEQVASRDQDMWTPLHFAARFHSDDNEIINHLMLKGADVNAQVCCLKHTHVSGSCGTILQILLWCEMQ